ncbi:hypothetical protein HYW35_00070 [Candidatus Saccharibacteria bacterium]|nr:hypothetical protein [Candidatus Saccharibacteria bacterium]
MKNNQTGFGHTMIVAAVVAVVAIAGVGYFVFAKNDSKSAKNSSPTSITASSSASKETADQKAVKAAAKEHFTLVYQKKIQEAYKVTCPDFKSLMTYEKFQSYLSNPGFQTIDLSDVEYTSTDVRNNQAKISGSVGPLSPNSTLAVSLLKKSDQWCIYGYEIK